MATRQIAHVVRPENPLVLPDGHRVCCDAAQWLMAESSRCPVAFPRDEIIHLAFLDWDPWQALKRIRLEVGLLKAQSTYACPYTGYLHNMLVPLAVVVRRSSLYSVAVAEAYPESQALDFAHVRAALAEGYTRPYATDVQRSFLGPGYTTQHPEALGTFDHGTVPLSNGDILQVFYRVTFVDRKRTNGKATPRDVPAVEAGRDE